MDGGGRRKVCLLGDRQSRICQQVRKMRVGKLWYFQGKGGDLQLSKCVLIARNAMEGQRNGAFFLEFYYCLDDISMLGRARDIGKGCINLVYSLFIITSNSNMTRVDIVFIADM